MEWVVHLVIPGERDQYVAVQTQGKCADEAITNARKLFVKGNEARHYMPAQRLGYSI